PSSVPAGSNLIHVGLDPGIPSPRARPLREITAHVSKGRRVHPPNSVTGKCRNWLIRSGDDVGHHALQGFLCFLEQSVIGPAKTGLVPPVTADALRRAPAHAVTPVAAPGAPSVILRNLRKDLISNTTETAVIEVRLFKTRIHMPGFCRLEAVGRGSVR